LDESKGKRWQSIDQWRLRVEDNVCPISPKL
jgi:hypothetical protein